MTLRDAIAISASALLIQLATPSQAQEGDRSQANGESLYPPLSYDGRYVAFFSKASNLVQGDHNGFGDIFIRDTHENNTQIVSVTADGKSGSGESIWPTISGNGRFVAFTSDASDLVKNDNNRSRDVFVYDTENKTTERVSVSSSGEEAKGGSYTYFPSVSYDGRFVVFMSDANDLVPGDVNNHWDVFVRDRDAKITRRVSTTYDGKDGNGPSLHAVISGDGHTVAFNSSANNLVQGDRNEVEDVFAYDLRKGMISRISNGRNGTDSDGNSDRAAISFDGRRIAFSSVATNLVSFDSNSTEDVFVYDSDTRGTSIVSLGTSGAPMQKSDVPWCCYISPACCIVVVISDRKSVMSADGNSVVYRSDATNLISGDFNGYEDIFVHNCAARTTERVSVSSTGAEANGPSIHHGVSMDGRFISFSSEASNLVEHDTNGVSDIFLRDRATGTTTRVSVPSR